MTNIYSKREAAEQFRHAVVKEIGYFTSLESPDPNTYVFETSPENGLAEDSNVAFSKCVITLTFTSKDSE